MKKLSFMILIGISLLPPLYAQQTQKNTITSTNSTGSSSSTKNYPQLGPEVPPIPIPSGAFWQPSGDGGYNYFGLHFYLQSIPYKADFTITKDGQISISAISEDNKQFYVWTFFKNGNLKSVESKSDLGNGIVKTENWTWDTGPLFDYTSNQPTTSKLTKINSDNAQFPSNSYPEKSGIIPSTRPGFGPNSDSGESIPYNSKNDPLFPGLIPQFPKPSEGGIWDNNTNTYTLNNATIINPATHKPISSNFSIQFTYDANNNIQTIQAIDQNLALTMTWNFDSHGTLILFKNDQWLGTGHEIDTAGLYSGDVYVFKSSAEPNNVYYERYPVGSDNKRTSNIFNYPLPQGYAQITDRDVLKTKNQSLQKESEGQETLITK
jgi:hypothetical protein